MYSRLALEKEREIVTALRKEYAVMYMEMYMYMYKLYKDAYNRIYMYTYIQAAAVA